jgi:hypothetical protein
MDREASESPAAKPLLGKRVFAGLVLRGQRGGQCLLRRSRQGEETMNRNTLRAAIVIFGLLTAVAHFYLLVRPGYGFSYPFPGAFLLNGLGYLILLGAMFLNIPMLDSVRRDVPWALILFTAVTIASFFKWGDIHDSLGWVTSGDEALLIISTFLYQRQGS